MAEPQSTALPVWLHPPDINQNKSFVGILLPIIKVFEARMKKRNIKNEISYAMISL